MIGMGAGGMGLIMAIPAIIIVLILLVVVGAFDKTYTQSNTALETLQLRLARGEITPEEYSSLREQLMR